MKTLFTSLSKKDWLYLLYSSILVVLSVYFDLKMPDYTASLSEAVTGSDLSMNIILQNGAMMLLCAAGSLISIIGSTYFTTEIAASVAHTLRHKLFHHISEFSQKEMNQFGSSSLITRTTNDVMQVQFFCALGLTSIIRAPITAVWALTKMSSVNIEWTWSVLITVVILCACIGVIVYLTLPRFRIIQKLTDSMNRVSRENISGVRVVRAFNAESFQATRFARVNNELTKNQLFTMRTLGLLMPVIYLAQNGLTLAIYWIGAILINNAASIPEKITLVGNMTAFTQYGLQVVLAFMMLILIFLLLPRVAVSLNRITEVLKTRPSILYPEHFEPSASENKGKLEFKNVFFNYRDGEEGGLQNLNFTIEPGQTTAIIGATGSGKSTLINLIPRLYDVSKGEILLDGKNLREYSYEELRSRISLAPQKAILFKGDIASNVAYGDSNPDQERIAQALKISQSNFVNDLDLKQQAPVAQGGTNFSGGQKQRLSIARAIYKDSDILIFDDTFSALDYQTDYQLRKELNESLKDKTKILVAQRIGTVKDADQILVLEDGKIVGIGTHETLLQNCPVYREIALSQLSEEEL